MRKILLPAIVLIASVLVTTEASAFHPFGGPVMQAIDQLDLSSDQRSQVRKVLMSHRGEGQQEGEKLRGSMEKFIALDPGSASYDSEVKSLASEAADESRGRTTKIAGVQRQIFPILTATQRAKLPGLIENTQLKGHGGHMNGPLNEELDELDLSDSQWLSIHKIMESQKASNQANQPAMRQLIADFAILDPSSSHYASDLQSISDRFAQNASTHVMEFGDVKKQIYAVLTPAQRGQLTASMQERLKDFQPGRGRGGMPPQPAM